MPLEQQDPQIRIPKSNPSPSKCSGHMRTILSAALGPIPEVSVGPQCPVGGQWIVKMCVYTVGYCIAVKNDKVMQYAATWMELDDSHLYEVRQKIGKRRMASLTCGI